VTAPGAGAGGDLAQVNSATSTPPEPAPAPTASSPLGDGAGSAGDAAPPTDRAGELTAKTTAVRRKSLVRAIGLALLAGLSGLAGALLLQRGIISDQFPPVLSNQQYATITRYSGPWLTAAAGAALLSGLLLLAAGVQLARWFQRSRRGDGGRTK